MPLCLCPPSPGLQLHYQHQVVQNLHQLWQQCSLLPLKTDEARAGQEDALSPRARPGPLPVVFVDKAQADLEHSMSSRSSRSSRSPVLDASQLQLKQESETLKETRESFLSQKTGVGSKSFPRKSIMEEILVEESPDRENTRSPWELESLPLPKWNLCLEDFRKVPLRLWRGWWRRSLGVLLQKLPLARGHIDETRGPRKK